ncbi:kinase-like protein [Gigaspora margarita]|uniref:Kinase-like protein n=1 Tax=Gigaspora margarita TaxID=4874 RepID=A0A8H4EN56_GIGMA|nr:kinase-like protein [Gigaspora margarita]
MIQQIKNDNFTLELEKWTNDYKFFKENRSIKFFPYNFIEKLQFDGTMLSNNSCKAFSEKHNKIMVLNQIGFSKNYSLDCFIHDLMQFKNVELHENILKFVGIVKLDIKEIIFIHEYAYNGTLRQYLKQSFSIINWNDKLRLAKQIVSAIKYLHENDIVHRNLHPEKIFIHKDPQYLQNLETYKLDKSSDIYSIGIILWEISSGITPFKSENSNLINSIIHGKREIAVSGTPKEYIKIYTECWQHKPDQRPIIQCVFTDLNNINFNDNEEVFTDHEKYVEHKDISVSETEDLDTVKLLKNYTELYNDIVKELSLISSIIATLKKALKISY